MGEDARLLLALGATAVLIALALLTFIAVRVDALAKAKRPEPRRATLRAVAEIATARPSPTSVPSHREPLAIDEEEMFNPTLKGPHR